MRQFLNKLFGYRWSLYVTDENKNLYYYTHSDNVISLIFSVAHFFVDNGNPKKPWCIYLNFNKSHCDFKLTKAYFTKDGNHLTKELLDKIESIDPNYRVPYNPNHKPTYAVDVMKNKRILFSPNIDLNNPSIILNSLSNDKQENTFLDVLITIFHNK